MNDIPADAFTLPFTALPEHIDELGHVNNAVWVQWIQTLSTSHWTAQATAEEQAAYIWVIVRHAIDYHRPLHEGESVTGNTWVADRPKGAKFDRTIRFVGKDGRAHVSAVTSWALLDRATGRPLRVPQTLVERFATA
jgi:acyl-CoA thioester hydrolase